MQVGELPEMGGVRKARYDAWALPREASQRQRWPGDRREGCFYTDFIQNGLIPKAGQKPPVCLSPQGDSLLALWKVERRQLKNIITLVIKCSLEIHGLFETQESEEGLDIRVKIGKLLRKRRCCSSWI